MNANDHVPMVNIMPFGFCKKGMPCMPVTPVAWVDVNKKHIIDGAPALTEDSKLACAHGGVITIVPLDAGSAEEGKMNEIVESAVEKVGLALKMAGAIADCIDVFSPGGLVKMAGKKGAAKNLKGGGNKGSGSEGVENKGQASNKSLENRGNNKEGVGNAANINGKSFENLLTKKLGGNGSFSKGGRDFDGGVGNRWWEAKSGEYWDLLLSSPTKEGKFYSDMGSRLKIAQENGATYELFSNTPIPQKYKNWLTKKGIKFTEQLE